ncbi:Gfo/Idh/MocA family protein [Mycetocola zhadangensis]|uniref:Gfo/Idh/MocA family protein n=1 Tax=Mycetocola zhadangensis TaxID=1164595 RepID=UPI0019A15B24|nr:Gfo/Idh/MocA family oxidoreductase [Mycetocola zhadangensis]GGE87781.1 oxidoreductase [Mycetocola zhadangensis]
MGKQVAPLKIGIVGCGHIIGAYLETFPKLQSVRLVAVADLDRSRADAVAAEYDGVRSLSVDELMADNEVQLVLNLTIPAAHAEIARQAILAGKQVYGEKPLAADTVQAATILAAAEKAGLTIGCAPDTVLGTGTQTARRAIDDGLIGTPISATATMMTPGHERWHPNPDFYYLPGGGPLLDMGPYYVSALITLLGPVASVIGAASHTRDSRTIGSGPRKGESIAVSTDTHVTGVLVHESGALSTLVMSFDAVATQAANIEIHGERGSLIVPDPNRFDGDVKLCGLGSTEWETLPVSAGYVDASRGVGLHDLAVTEKDVEPRASARLAFHALDVMESVLSSARSGQSISISSTCERPTPVPLTELSVRA